MSEGVEAALTFLLTSLLNESHPKCCLTCLPVRGVIMTQTLKAFESRGIHAKRIDLLPLLPDTTQHLRAYSLVDISLDTFPYAGTTTSCESLFMGVRLVFCFLDTVHGRGVES
jgi:predicted O-linked N-acetylglucosamine transferase (SPINDLY family)